MIFLPVEASQNLMVLSSLAEAMRVPSGLKLTLVTALVCPLSVLITSPVAALHNLMVLSSLPEAIRVPSGLKLTSRTVLAGP